MNQLHQKIYCLDILIYKTQSNISQESELEPYFKFHFFETGSGNVRSAQKLYPVIPPCILCLSDRDEAVFNGHGATIRSLYFKPAIINSTFDFEVVRRNLQELQGSQRLDIYWILPFVNNNGLILLGPNTGNRISELLNSMTNELEQRKGTYWPCRTRSFLYELLNIVIASTDESPDRMELKNIDPEIQDIIQYLNANYHRKISIAEICERFAVNRTTLSEKFKAETNTTVMNYLAKIRIQIACVLLRDTTLRIYEIMSRVGYEDTTHFGRCFRKVTGKSPSEYRETFGD